MSVPRVSLIVVGKMEAAEVEAAAARISKVLKAPVTLRGPATLPKTSEDASRHQHAALTLLSGLRSEIPRLAVTKTVGAEVAADPAPPGSDVAIFVTDVDLFTPTTDASYGEADAAHHAGVVSVRRLREAFYRRKPDPARLRSRLAKEILRIAARLRGLPECGNPACALSPTRSTGDLDRKDEHYCAPCWKRLSAGTMRI